MSGWIELSRPSGVPEEQQLSEMPPEPPEPAPVRRSRRLPWRSAVQKLHLWIGLAVAAPVCVLGLTGSVLVFQHEFESGFGPTVPPSGGEPRPIEDVVAAAATVVA